MVSYPASGGLSIFLDKSGRGRSKGLCSQGSNQRTFGCIYRLLLLHFLYIIGSLRKHTSVTSPAAKSEEKRMFSRAIYMEVYKKSFCVIRQVRTDIAKEFSEFSFTVCFKLRRQV